MISEKLEDTNKNPLEHGRSQKDISIKKEKEDEKFILLLQQYRELLEELKAEAVEADFDAKSPDK